MENKRVAVVGGGIAGLTAALRLAEYGYGVDLYEAAPALGGRTKSFYDEEVDEWVDNGPHLMVGAYHATKRLLADVDAVANVTWQSSLTLPLWDSQRGFFALKAPSWLPVNLALIWAVYRMPKHDWGSVKAMLRLALTMGNRPDSQTVQQWIESIHAPNHLVKDMLEVLCLGVMNEPLATANAKTFASVLATSFSSHANAKMGWFNQPLSKALIAPVANKLRALGVNMELRRTVRNLEELEHDAVVLALPSFARDRLLGMTTQVETHAITNIHCWFDKPIALPAMMLGMLDTYGQWVFDVSAMHKDKTGSQHISVTISADTSDKTQDELIAMVLLELNEMIGQDIPQPKKVRFIREKRATVLVRKVQKVDIPSHVFDAGESPIVGGLPATIELAVISGEKAAALVHKSHEINA